MLAARQGIATQKTNSMVRNVKILPALTKEQEKGGNVVLIQCK